MALCIAGPAHAQSLPLCSSEGASAPAVLFERFINADCAACWTAADTPAATPGALALDWVLPGALREAAPVAVVALPEAEIRHEMLAGSSPRPVSLLLTTEHSSPPLHVAHGLALGGYVGTSLTFSGARSDAEPLTGWLALIERLPVGTEASPVARTLVRNLITEPIAEQPPNDGVRAQIWCPMSVPDGARPEHLGMAGWVTDWRGRVLAVAQSHSDAAETESSPTSATGTP